MAIRNVFLTIALVHFSLPLLAGGPEGRHANNQKQAAAPAILSVTGSIVIRSEVATFFVHPIKCDGDGNIYLMTQVDATTGIHKLSPKGQRVATFAASSASDLSVQNGGYFAVTSDGRRISTSLFTGAV